MPAKKEIRLPTLAQAMARSKNQPKTPKAEVIVPSPEEPKFYGAEFATIIQTFRKMGTLREKNSKRAGLVKGLRLMSHTHPDADSPSIADIPLVILDVYHGRLADVFAKHKLKDPLYHAAILADLNTAKALSQPQP